MTFEQAESTFMKILQVKKTCWIAWYVPVTGVTKYTSQLYLAHKVTETRLNKAQ
jgi:hypothetical protein